MYDLAQSTSLITLGHDFKLDRVDLGRLTGGPELMREVGSGTRLLAERFLARYGIEPRIGMEIGSNETIKQAVMAGLGIAFISAHTIAAEISDGRLTILDVVGLPDIRQWFVVRPAAKRMMPAARSLRDFLIAEGRRFLPTVEQYRTKRPGRSRGRLGNKYTNRRKHPGSPRVL